jgi:hypothetical protein
VKPHRLRVLFILKKRYCYNGHYAEGLSSGLYNSAKFAAEMLEDNGIFAKVVEVCDNNDIDREVTRFKPDIVIIEALWVVPSKFAILQSLHPKVTWVVRIHSEAAFLAQEGIAIEWVSRYPLYMNVFVAVNSREAFTQFMSFFPDKGLPTSKLLYLPTYYPAPKKPLYNKKFSGTTISIACMGAVRQLKNSMIQAMAAMRFADDKGWTLRFHVNASLFNIEGNAPYRSIVSLFQGTRHTLVAHDWMDHKDFIDFLKEIDLGMQVSFSETFCIVAADIVACGIPIVGSHAIRWLEKKSMADAISIENIVAHLGRAIKNGVLPISLVQSNLKRLRAGAEKDKQAWLDAMAHIS